MSILGIDVGGTFTDAVLVSDGRISTAKVPTTARQEDSVLAAARAVGAAELDRFTHGTTVATNALLERRGVPTLFVTNAGFGDLLAIGTQERPELFDAVVISAEVGLRKPDPAIYRLAAQRLGRPPEAIVLVDDLPGNLKPARAAGMATVVHRDAAATLAELEALLGVPLSRR